MGASGEPPAAYGRYQNIFLSQTEYDELQTEYPDRLERFIEEMSRYLAASGKSYQNYAAALRIWAGGKRQKGRPEKGHTRLLMQGGREFMKNEINAVFGEYDGHHPGAGGLHRRGRFTVLRQVP